MRVNINQKNVNILVSFVESCLLIGRQDQVVNSHIRCRARRVDVDNYIVNRMHNA